MKRSAVVLLILAFALAAFGCWGLYTDAGRNRFDEMSGMIPFFALVLAVVLTLITGILFLIYILRKKNKNTDL